MGIKQGKKEFIKKISQGTYTADDIAINPECEIEEYIQKHLLDHEIGPRTSSTPSWTMRVTS